MRASRRAVTASLAALLGAAAIGITVTDGDVVADAATAPSGAVVPPGRGDAGAPAGQEQPPPVFPRPGGGRVAIHSYSGLDGVDCYLLDPVAGTYRRLPYVSVQLAPGGRTVAVEDIDGRVGVADRQALLRAGDAAVHWTALPPGSWSGWSPDGAALLTTTLDKDAGTFIAHRYEVRSGQLRHTPIDLDCETCTAGWAADSTRYVVQLRSSDPASADGPMTYLNPDGTAGPLVGATGHIWNADAYSASRRYATVEPSRGGPVPEEPEDWQLPRILDLRKRQIVRAIDTRWPVLGWYDRGRVVRFAPESQGSDSVMEVVDVRTGVVTKRIPAPGLSAAAIVQLGSSTGLTGPAADYGF